MNRRAPRIKVQSAPTPALAPACVVFAAAGEMPPGMPVCLAGDPALADDCWRFAADLFNQQLWCWGCDIKYRGGNLLLTNGLTRTKPPRGCSAPSIYETTAGACGRICLRGFGVFYGDDRWGGLFVKRYTFAPGWTAQSTLESPPWDCEDLPPLATPASDEAGCRQLLRGMVDWIADYESAIAARPGIEHRRQTLSRWHETGVVARAECVSRVWRRLGELLAGQFPLPTDAARVSLRSAGPGSARSA